MNRKKRERRNRFSCGNSPGLSDRGWTCYRSDSDLRGPEASWLEKSHAAQPPSQESMRRGHRSLKKINACVQRLKELSTSGKVRLMFQDEAAFGRVAEPKYCWCRRYSTERSLPSHPRIPLCLRRRRAAYGRKPLSDHAQLRYRLYECLPAGTLAKILGRSDPALLRRRRLAQVQDA